MGSRGPLPKDAEKRQGHADLVVVQPGNAPERAPKPPAGWLASTRKAWAAYWASDVAGVVTDAEKPIVLRYFDYVDEHTRALSVLRRGERTVDGSKGQLRLNPMADYALKLEAALSRIENTLGLSPLARARLGLVVGQARLTASEVNRMAALDDGAGGDDEVIDGYEPA